ncbi:MAG TPA: rRNA maturation RNase YbeY [Pyrinomonadaceae bacterium]|nr:rRNA maturation RNase YbeY [Pyrinomonadaceae bacterium]
MVVIINRQRLRPVNGHLEFIARALQAMGTSSDVTIVFVRDAAMRKLNRQFRSRDYATDVLSFPTSAEQFEAENQAQLGEVVISVDRAAAQAKENGLSFANEVRQLILHGLLHLCGYDHETDHGEMNRLELKLRKKLGI